MAKEVSVVKISAVAREGSMFKERSVFATSLFHLKKGLLTQPS